MVSIATIAKLAQVSPATAARVVNNNGYVSEQKRAAVMRAIEQTGYVPNMMAGSLRRKKTNFIGYVLPELSENPFFTRFGNSFDRAAQEAGYQVITMITHWHPEREKQLVTSLVGLMVEAIVFLGTTLSAETIEWVLSQDIPVIMIEHPEKLMGVDTIQIDNYMAVQMAVDHIVKKGHRRIGYIGRDFDGRTERQRILGFTESMCAHRLAIPGNLVCTIPDYSPECGRQAISRMLESGEIPTAVLCASDVLACGVLQELYQRGIRVPEDLSLVGFDNTLSALCAPMLTSMELQPDLVGKGAVEMVIERCQKDRASAKSVIFSPVLIDRKSVKCIKEGIR